MDYNFDKLENTRARLAFSITVVRVHRALIPSIYGNNSGFQTKTNRDLVARVFPRLALVTCICFEF